MKVGAREIDDERPRSRPRLTPQSLGRVIDEKGRGLEPMCLRPWQKL